MADKLDQSIPATHNTADSVVQVLSTESSFLGMEMHRWGSGVFVESKDPDKCYVATTNFLSNPDGLSVVTKDGVHHAVGDQVHAENGLAFLEVPDIPKEQCPGLSVSETIDPSRAVNAVGAIDNGWLKSDITPQIEPVTFIGDRQVQENSAQSGVAGLHTVGAFRVRELEGRPSGLDHAFGGGALVQDGKLVGLIRGGSSSFLSSIRSEDMIEKMKRFGLK